MQHVEGQMNSADGLALFTQAWLPDGDAAAGVVLLHGIGEHSGRYLDLAGALVDAGVGVYSFDGRGHGRSPGRRGYIGRLADYLSDIDLRVAEVRAALGERPLFLMGQSMGGGLATRYALDHQAKLDGLVLTAPALQAGEDISPLLIRVAGILSRVAPTLPTQKLDLQLLSRRAEVVEAFAADPLTHKQGIAARTGAELLRMIADIQSGMGRLTLPLLIMHGTADRLTNPAGSRLLFDRAAARDKTLKMYDGLYHEIMNEPERGEVIGFIIDWLNARR
jgi:alpha-beta hydrolase superfamily lysophospholipase